MLFNHILLTFKDVDIKKSVKDLDQDDIVYKNINTIFKTKENYLEYCLKNSIYANFVKFQQYLYLGFNILIFLNYSDSYLNNLFICCVLDTISIILSIKLDIWGKKEIENKNIENTKLYQKYSLGLTGLTFLLLIYVIMSRLFFNNNQNLVYHYWSIKLKWVGFGGVVGFFLGAIYLNTNYTFLKIRNKLEKVRKIFCNSYQHAELDGFSINIYNVCNLKTFKLKKDHDICAICRQDQKQDETVIKLKCNHMYHKDCIKLWFNTEFRCPYCRKFVI